MNGAPRSASEERRLRSRERNDRMALQRAQSEERRAQREEQQLAEAARAREAEVGQGADLEQRLGADAAQREEDRADAAQEDEDRADAAQGRLADAARAEEARRRLEEEEEEQEGQHRYGLGPGAAGMGQPHEEHRMELPVLHELVALLRAQPIQPPPQPAPQPAPPPYVPPVQRREFKSAPYSGTGSVEVFIQHFTDVSLANHWGDGAALLHLRAALEGRLWLWARPCYCLCQPQSPVWADSQRSQG